MTLAYDILTNLAVNLVADLGTLAQALFDALVQVAGFPG